MADSFRVIGFDVAAKTLTLKNLQTLDDVETISIPGDSLRQLGAKGGMMKNLMGKELSYMAVCVYLPENQEIEETPEEAHQNSQELAQAVVATQSPSILQKASTWFYEGSEDDYMADDNACNIGYSLPIDQRKCPDGHMCPGAVCNPEKHKSISMATEGVSCPGPKTAYTLFGPYLRHLAVGERFMEELERKYPGRYYGMIRHDKAHDLWDLLDMMAKTGPYA